ncbi:hypothetical protein ACF073_29450 [Streptomyces sp. NPDC015171]|uniref:hypothetical protein n=1 Tax=Streptomyces sp. NPDC015171 TaxID=3364945 RepID=UPI0036FF65CF
MPFGSADRAQLQRITEQLGKLAADLAAVQQQVADQQHAMDQIRQDTTAALRTGLGEIRADARDALVRAHESTAVPLAGMGGELAALRGAVGRLDDTLGRTQTVAPPVTDTHPPSDPAPGPEHPEPEPQVPPRQAGSEPRRPDGAGTAGQGEPDEAVLRAAAGVAHATLEAHRDTWAFLVQVAGSEQHFHIPGRVEDHEGFVSVRFSGPSLVAALISLAHIAGTTGNPVTRAIADHIRLKITGAVRAVIDTPARDGEGTPVRIVVDDRSAPVGTVDP